MLRQWLRRLNILLVMCLLLSTASLSMARTSALAAAHVTHNIAYVSYDDLGFTGSSGASGNIFANGIVGGPAPTGSAADSVTYNSMTFTPMTKAALSAGSLANYDTLILFEVCDIATVFSSSQLAAINAYLAAGNKILLFDGDRCAPGYGGQANYAWFTFPFATSSPGPQGAVGTLNVVENSTLTQGLAADPFNSDELGDANTATTADPHWKAAAKTTNALGNNGYFLAYASNTGLIIYNGADYWATDGPTKSLTDLFLNELNQQYDPDGLPGTIPINGGRGAVVFLVPGIQSQLKSNVAGTVTGDNGYFDTFWPLLQNDLGPGLSQAVPFVYSYTGLKPNQSDPNDYLCQDTYDHSISNDVTTLNTEITAYLTLHPNTDVYLVGHSQGGLIAFSYLAYFRSQQNPWTLPFGGQLKGIVTLDSPLGGIPSAADTLTSQYLLNTPAPKGCPAMKQNGGAGGFKDMNNFGDIAKTIPNGALPHGGTASVAHALNYTPSDITLSNQTLATLATQHGIGVLTVGNTRDFLYAPCPAIPGVSGLNISTQWLSDAGTNSGPGPFGRAVALGTTTCTPPYSGGDLSVNHGLILGNQDAVGISGMAHFLAGNGPAPLLLPEADLVTRVSYRIAGIFTIQLANYGGSSASGVLLHVNVNGGGTVLVVSVIPSGLTCTPPVTVSGQFDCSGQIDVYQTRTLQVIVLPRIQSGLPVIETVTVTANANPTGSIPELDTSNNVSQASGRD